MKKTYRFTAILLAFSLLLSLFSCAKGENGDETKSQKIELTDQAGRTVVLEKEAERVVSCYYVTTYAMISLGIEEKLVGIEKKAESRPIYAMANPSLLSLPAVGSLKGIDCETIASLVPDLVILPKKLADAVESLEALGIPVLLVDPETEENLQEMLRLIGKACGATAQAENLIAFSSEKLSGFTQPQTKPSVLFLGNSSFLTAAPSGMYQSNVIMLAGGSNALKSEGNYWKELDYETMLTLNPDYIVIPSGASYTAAELQTDSVLSGLSAVSEGRILRMPGNFEEWDSPIPSAVLGVLWLRAALYPAQYGADSFREDAVEFYERFYGFTPSNEALAALCE